MREEAGTGAWRGFCRAGATGLRTALIAVLAGALAGCIALDARKREAVYRPTPGVPATFPGLRPGDEAWSVELRQPVPVRLIGGDALPAGAPQQVRLWWLPHAQRGAPTLLYLHGTFRNLYQNLAKIEALRGAGYAVLAVDYRGWGSSTPLSPSEATIVADARLAWHELVRREPDPRRRVVYGHSMGGAVAVALASQLRHPADYAGLILESTFTSLPDVAASAGLLGRVGAWIAPERFDSLARIATVTAPMLMLHGEADRTVPFALGRRLFDAAPMREKAFVTIPGGSHSGLQSDAPDTYRDAVSGFAARLPR